MTWQNIEGHDQIAAAFARGFVRGRLEGSYLFTGPEGIGKRSFAFALAKTLLCQKIAEREQTNDDMDTRRFTPCGECESCRLFESNSPQDESEEAAPKKKKKRAKAASEHFTIPTHPDFYFVNKPPDRSFIPLELLIGTKEERMRSGLCFDLSRTPYLGGRKIAVIDDADFLNPEGANALLKTLEEPPPKSILILVGTASTKQLPTIRSRCRVIRFSPLSTDRLAAVLSAKNGDLAFDDALRLARFAEGSVRKANLFADEALETFRGELYRYLTADDAAHRAKAIVTFTDLAGKEASARRERLRIVLTWCAEFYRDLVRIIAGESPAGGDFLLTGPFLKKASQGVRAEQAEAAARRTLEALEQIDRNAHLPVLIECWAYDIAKTLEPQKN